MVGISNEEQASKGARTDRGDPSVYCATMFDDSLRISIMVRSISRPRVSQRPEDIAIRINSRREEATHEPGSHELE